MNTISQWISALPEIPMGSVWLLNDLSEYRGKQELFTKQSPQKLKALREHALIESAVCSNRIEGVEVDQKRIGTVLFGKGHLQDRDEEEVRGYQQVLSWIHSEGDSIPLSVETILKLHAMTRPNIWDSGRFKKDDGEIIEKHPDGRVTLRFKPLSAAETPNAMEQLCADLQRLLRDGEVPPLLLLAAFNLDFLCIHPFRDGNGRVSRLLLLLLMYHLGFEAGRYISLERIIEQSKERYYDTLRDSSQGWHEAEHNPWPYINYLLYTIKELYREFEDRYENTALPRGEKTLMVERAVKKTGSEFSVSDLQKACPGVGIDLIRRSLKLMQERGEVKCVRKGRGAKWMQMN